MYINFIYSFHSISFYIWVIHIDVLYWFLYNFILLYVCRPTLFDFTLYFMAQGPVEDQSITEQATPYKDLK